MYHHNNNIAHALVELFPEIAFLVENFATMPRMSLSIFYLLSFVSLSILSIYISNFMKEPDWRFYTNRKLFFEKYASERGFDPANHENWYTEESQQFLHEVRETYIYFSFLNLLFSSCLFHSNSLV